MIKIMNKNLLLTTAGIVTVLSSFSQNNHISESKPNIIIILADDMGYSDIGCYGSEIKTPNIDKLAKNGLRFTQFYNSARCCPTRASLLTGLNPHQAGMGHMAGSNLSPNYQGFLNNNCVTIAHVLKTAGYATAMTGKWHVGNVDESIRPIQRGFDRFYGSPSGGGFYSGKVTGGRSIFEGNNEVIPPGTQLPKEFYTTNKWADKGIEYINEAINQKKPFFLYLAFNSPHWPLQAPASAIKKYLGKYKNGVESLRKARYEKMLQLGIIDKNFILTPADETVKSWESLTEPEKLFQDSIMATYAACVDVMDLNIGKLVNNLKQKGALDNTIIFFLSDNGGCAEGPKNGLGNNSGTGAVGSPESFVRGGRGWSNLENTPFKLYKHNTHEGGIHTPFIVHWPNGIKGKNEIRKQTGHIIDLMATCIDISKATYPKSLNGNSIIPYEGVSLVPAFTNHSLNRDTICWEHEANRAIRIKNWKLVAEANQSRIFTSEEMNNWELYDLDKDPTEMKNLAFTHPEKVKEMSDAWIKWALVKNVLPSPWGDFGSVPMLKLNNTKKGKKAIEE